MVENLSQWLSREEGERTGGNGSKANSGTNPVVPGEETGFTAEAKDGALEVNERLRESVDSHGRVLDFGSRTRAEKFVVRLSNAGGALRLQAVPDNEPRDIDAYILADHNPSIKEPAAVDGDTLTFEVGANLYGSLGETIVFGSPKPYPLLHFIRQDFGIDKDDSDVRLNLDINRGRPISFGQSADRDSWTPDCVVEATNGWDGELLERYYCEIKTGDASFQRSQAATMKRLASDERVLKIRVRIDELPEQYSVRIHEVEPSE
jgi:hypothetical protein